MDRKNKRDLALVRPPPCPEEVQMLDGHLVFCCLEHHNLSEREAINTHNLSHREEIITHNLSNREAINSMTIMIQMR